jgi:multisubunit Na+/H+ antiporter MnhG subunit
VGRIIAIYFLTWILVVSISALIWAVLGVAAHGLTRAAGTTASAVFRQVVSTVVNIIVTPVMSIALTLAYYDQRVRKEAFDIESMMSLLGEPGSAPAENTMGATS